MKTITTTYITLDSEDGYSAVQEIIKYVSGLISDRNGKMMIFFLSTSIEA